jgi:hypothetical protein
VGYGFEHNGTLGRNEESHSKLLGRRQVVDACQSFEEA